MDIKVRPENEKIAITILEDLEKLNIVKKFEDDKIKNAVVEYIGFIIQSSTDSHAKAVSLLKRAKAIYEEKQENRVRLDGGDLGD
jgi:hypothetical protein